MVLSSTIWASMGICLRLPMAVDDHLHCRRSSLVHDVLLLPSWALG